MNLILTTDMAVVKGIMMEPDIWERAAEDGVDQDTFYPTYDDMSVWLLCVEGEQIIGLILLHMDNSVTLKMHPYLRKKYRQKGSLMMKAFYEWVLENTGDTINKIIISIPENHQKVINFAKKMGFIKEGINRDSVMKDGHIYNQHNLGITRKEIGEYLWQQQSE